MMYATMLTKSLLLLLLVFTACRPKPLVQQAAEAYCDYLREKGATTRSSLDTLEFAKIVYQGRLVEKYPGAKMFYIRMAYTPVERKADWTERERSMLFMLDFIKYVRQQGYSLIEFK